MKEIAEVKMASPGFYVDIISLFPAYIFSDTLDPQGASVAGQVAKLFPALQVWHIWDYFGKWENNFDAHVKVGVLLILKPELQLRLRGLKWPLTNSSKNKNKLFFSFL